MTAGCLSEEELKDSLTVLVMIDSSCRGPFVHALVAKGADVDGYAAARVVEDVEFLGHTKVIL